MRFCVNVTLMAVRFLLAILALGIGSLTPTLPDQLASASKHKVQCCADMNVANSHSCPISRGANNSTAGSTCCSSQAPCFVCYSHAADDFLARVNAIGFTSFVNDRVTVRAQRPPVPPPRIAFS